MNKISFLNNFSRKVSSLGISHKEACVILAVAELTSGKHKECTSDEVRNMMSQPSISGTLKSMKWAFNSRQAINDRGKIVYNYSLNEASLKIVAKVLEYTEVDIESFRRVDNTNKRGAYSKKSKPL